MYSLYPAIRRKMPQEDVSLIRTDFLETVAALYVTLAHRIETSNILTLDDEAWSASPDGRLSQGTKRMHILPRLSTPMVGIFSMIQLCRKVNVFGFDPEGIRHKVSINMGLKSGSYYEDKAVLYDLAREDDLLQLAAVNEKANGAQDGEDHSPAVDVESTSTAGE